MKMNVFYLGVDNPVAISVPGVPDNKVFASTTNGIIRRSGKDWVTLPKTPGNALVEVQVEMEGKRKSMGFMDFRVKQIPDPIAMVSFKKGGKVDKNTLLQSAIVDAVLEGFDFDAKFTVSEFSNRINDRQREIIKSANKGDKVYISTIMAVGPDGKQRELNGIIFSIK